MPVPFDTNAEDQKLASIREREEEDLASVLSQKYALTYADLTISPVNVDALRLVPEKTARTAEAVVFDKNGKHLSFALRNPQNVTLPDLEAELASRGFILDTFLVSQKSLDHAYERYADLSFAQGSEAGVFTLPQAELAELRTKLTSISAFREHLDTLLAGHAHTQTSRLFEEILAAAFAMNASDIHIEPEEHEVHLRLRLDGLLASAYTLDAHLYATLTSRIKLLSGLKLNIDSRAQDGRFSVNIGSSEVEIRTSLIPGGYGESVVLRILNPESINVTFDSLGIHPKLLGALCML